MRGVGWRGRILDGILPGLLLGPLLGLLAGCTGLSESGAEDLVRAYNEQLMEAYRLGDPELMGGLVGDSEGRKLLGLIGAKLDMGLTLDSELQSMDFLGVERVGESVQVLTDETWHYRDRVVGTGEVFGPESTDHYLMRYVLRRPGGSWVVDAVRFEAEPEVGRADAFLPAHGRADRAAAGDRP